MIARTWHGAVPAGRGDEYLDYLQETGVRDLEATEGNQGVYVLRRDEGGETHFVMISLWRTLEDVAAFAGQPIEQARYYARDASFLLELEPRVKHYEVLVRPERAVEGDDGLEG